MKKEEILEKLRKERDYHRERAKTHWHDWKDMTNSWIESCWGRDSSGHQETKEAAESARQKFIKHSQREYDLLVTIVCIDEVLEDDNE